MDFFGISEFGKGPILQTYNLLILLPYSFDTQTFDTHLNNFVHNLYQSYLTTFVMYTYANGIMGTRYDTIIPKFIYIFIGIKVVFFFLLFRPKYIT